MSDGTNFWDEYRTWCHENMAKKLLEQKPNTFSILYRSGSGSTGNFTDDISDYFRNRLIEGSVDCTDEILIRTCPLSWTIYFEASYSIAQINGNSISTTDLIYNGAGPQYYLNIIENIPMCLFDKFNIINYPDWGEVVVFNYDALKAEILDTYIRSGSRETAEQSYQELADIMTRFPNKYDMLSEKIIHVLAEKPIELIREDTRILNLRHTEYFKRLIDEKRAFDMDRPNPDEDGVYSIENGRRIKGPNYASYDARWKEWKATYETWRNNIDQEYKLCFEACHKKGYIFITL
jgi:hypothetical protein